MLHVTGWVDKTAVTLFSGHVIQWSRNSVFTTNWLMYIQKSSSYPTTFRIRWF